MSKSFNLLIQTPSSWRSTHWNYKIRVFPDYLCLKCILDVSDNKRMSKLSSISRTCWCELSRYITIYKYKLILYMYLIYHYIYYTLYVIIIMNLLLVRALHIYHHYLHRPTHALFARTIICKCALKFSTSHNAPPKINPPFSSSSS